MLNGVNEYIVLDTETGGLNPERNPLLSVGLVRACGDKVLARLGVKCKPPEDTWLEIPQHADQLKGKYSKQIEHWLNLSTGQLVKPTEEKPARFITAVAAEVNGFVGASEAIPGWDMTRITLWGEFSYPEAAIRIADWLDANKGAEAVVAHNAEFDEGYIRSWLPEIMPLLPEPWLCTQYLYKNKFLGGKTKGSSLGAICKVAGYTSDAGQLHTELGDCAATHFIYEWLKTHG